MTLLFPGATWVPIPGQEKRARRRKGRGVGYHVAVYVGPSLAKIDAGTGNDSHLYVRFDGGIEQNVDLDRISYAMVDGNPTLITVETEGGADPATVETEPWTPQQCASLARILRWAHDTEGVPLELMPDSKPASKGACYHRQGVDPWRVPGGEKWSTHYGKVCPGAAKIAQIPGIVAAAQAGPIPVQAGDPEMRLVVTPDKAVWAVSDIEVELIRDVHLMGALLHAWGQDAPTPMPIPEVTMVQNDANARRARRALQVAAQVKGVDETQLAKDVVTGLAPQIAEALSGKTGISRDDLAAALAKFADSLKS